MPYTIHLDILTMNASLLHLACQVSGRNGTVSLIGLLSKKSQYELLPPGGDISECEKMIGIQNTTVTTHVKVIAVVDPNIKEKYCL